MAAYAATEREVIDNCCFTCVGCMHRCMRGCLVACWESCKLCCEDVSSIDSDTEELSQYVESEEAENVLETADVDNGPDVDEPRNSPPLLEAAELTTQSQAVQVLSEPIPVHVIPATPVHLASDS